jgi:hypothetical protein
MDDTAEKTGITELLILDPDRLDGVGSPANGSTGWVMLKSLDVQADPDSPRTDSPEADAQEDAMTKAEADEIEALLTKAEAAGFCGVIDCDVCKEHFGPLHGELMKRRLSAADRRAIPKDKFAIPEKAPGPGSYPVGDKTHAQAALRLMHNASPAEQKRIKAKVKREYPDIDVAKELELLQKSPGVPDESVQTPKEKGHLATGQSGLAGPVTAGHVRPETSPSYEAGGKTPYIIPDEAKVTNNPPFERRPRQEAMPQGSEDMGKESWEIEVVDKQNWVSLDNNPAMASEMPQEPSVQSANATVLDRIVCAYVALKEAMAAQKADPDGMTDPLDAQVWAHLEDVCATLKNALIDQALDSVGIDAALLKAENLLTKLGGADTTAGNGARTSEEENIMTTVTKEDLTALVSETAGAAAVAAVKEALKAERKAEKAKMKGKMKGKKPPFMQAEKNANNGGDITSQQEHAGVKGNHEAEDVGAVGGPVDGQYVNKEKSGKKDKAVKQVEALVEPLAKQIDDVQQLVAKMARRPRSGGPVLDGANRGAFPASEGRQTEAVAKGAGDPELERLEKEIAETEKRTGPDAAARLADLHQQKTYLRFYNAHQAGLL